ncbi:hypothetical protein RB195_025261 [Necator americanus]|uniref:DUF5641 domain-containing protein n=1 Tax=Necator americanus TaxID=51031 RepID=A0ABR1ERS4_NECAM
MLSELQVIQALGSSNRITEQFWQQWQQQYLTSLREKHLRDVTTKRGSRIPPKEGQVVLICDALQSRYTWKMGRVDGLIRNNEGTVREASVLLPSRRRIRRPPNLLVLLELDDVETNEGPEPTLLQQTPGISSETTQETMAGNLPIGTESSRYNLRQTRRLDYSKLTCNLDTVSVMSVTSAAVASVGSTTAGVLQSTSQNGGIQSRKFSSSDVIISLNIRQCIGILHGQRRFGQLLRNGTYSTGGTGGRTPQPSGAISASIATESEQGPNQGGPE